MQNHLYQLAHTTEFLPVKIMFYYRTRHFVDQALHLYHWAMKGTGATAKAFYKLHKIPETSAWVSYPRSRLTLQYLMRHAPTGTAIICVDKAMGLLCVKEFVLVISVLRT